jgi:hypothetical protein
MHELSMANVVKSVRAAKRRVSPARSKAVQFASAAVAAVALVAGGLMSSPPRAALAGDDPSSKSETQAANQANSSGFAAEMRRAVTEQRVRMINLANPLIESTELAKKTDPANDLEAQLAIQPTKIESAKARFQGAGLARQAAEIDVTEFEKGSFVREQISVEKEVALARRELERLRNCAPRSKERRQMIEQAKKDAKIDVAPLVIAELLEKKAGYVLEQAESKRKILLEYTNGVRSKELRLQSRRHGRMS